MMMISSLDYLLEMELNWLVGWSVSVCLTRNLSINTHLSINHICPSIYLLSIQVHPSISACISIHTFECENNSDFFISHSNLNISFLPNPIIDPIINQSSQFRLRPPGIHHQLPYIPRRMEGRDRSWNHSPRWILRPPRILCR